MADVQTPDNELPAAPLTDTQLAEVDRYWRAANYYPKARSI
jgi:hypothetical protein